jgi:hypothetical protein
MLIYLIFAFCHFDVYVFAAPREQRCERASAPKCKAALAILTDLIDGFVRRIAPCGEREDSDFEAP